MTKKHRSPEWVRVRAAVKPRLMAALPAPCPRCGGVMVAGMKLDLGHASTARGAEYDPSNLRLEHRRCNRADGARITASLRTRKKERPKW